MGKICSFCKREVKKLQIKNPAACMMCYQRYFQKNKSKDKREEKVQAKCEFNVSEKCIGEQPISIRSFEQTKDNNNGKYICLYCSRTLKFSGRNNPNCKYAFDDFYFKNIDSEEKAYFLGWIASDGSVNKNGFRISIHEKDKLILEQLRDLLCKELKITTKFSFSLNNFLSIMSDLTINSKQISEDICRHLNINPGKKSRVVNFPNLDNDFLKWAFVRGFFDGDGFVSRRNCSRSPKCGIGGNSKNMINYIFDFCKIPGALWVDKKECWHIEWSGNNALDFLGKIYEGAKFSLNRKRELYEDWCLWVPSLNSNNNKNYNGICKFNKTRKDAVIPTKSNVSDSGFDLVLLEKIKNMGDVELYTTGIKIQPCFGYYFDLVPRSSISKTGYMLANSLGIIDRTYIGEIFVALRKVNKDAPDLELPCKVVQIIPRQIVHFTWEEVDNIEETKRNDGGFGSTGK